MTWSRAAAVLALSATLSAMLSCASEERTGQPREFDRPDAAVQALIDTVASGTTDDLLAIFGSDAEALILPSDRVTARRNREVFAIAAAETWRLEDAGADARTLVIGHEQWPFPIPLVKVAGSAPARWRFDTAAGTEEVIARRIGRNELSVIRICRIYVTAQRIYAKQPHDGQPAGRYATAFRSDPGRQNGLYWPAKAGQPRSPLGDLVARAADEGRTLNDPSRPPVPFHGYYFRILTGPKGFGLVAWPAEYDVTGVMTFTIDQSGVLHQKDLGPQTDQDVRRLSQYAVDSTWTKVS